MLNATKATPPTVKECNGGSMFIEVLVGSKKIKTLVDSRATHSFIQIETAKKLNITYKKTSEALKTVNTSVKPIIGATNIQAKIGD